MKPRNLFHRIVAKPAFALAVLTLVTSSQAAPITKAATGTDLTAGASWTGSTAPTSSDIATWASTSLGAGLTLTSSTSWDGIGVTGALGTIGITGTSSLKLGSGGIDMALSTVNLTLGTPITLGSNQTWNVNSGRTLTASGIISGTGIGLTKAGAGTLTLTGANTYDGTTTIFGGTLVADTATNATILNTASPLAFTNSGTFQLKGLAAQTRSQTLAGLTLTSGAATIDANNTGTSTTIDLRGSGGTLTIARSAGTTVDFKASAGAFGTTAVVKTAQANVTGILGAWATVNTGADWAINNGSDVAAAYTGYNTLSGTTLATSATTNYRVATNPTTPTGNITMATTGTIDINTLRISDAAVRTIDVRNGATQGVLRFGTVGGLLISGINGHIIGVAGTGTAGTITAGGNTLDTSGELIVNTATNSTINSVIANNGSGAVTLTKSGAGTLTLSGVNTYTGNTTINAGTVVNNPSTSKIDFLGSSTSKTVTIQSGATLSLQQANLTGSQLILNGGTLQMDNGGGPSTWNGAVVLNANSISNNTGNGNGATNINGNISGVGGLTRTSAAGTAHQPLVLNGTNTYTGPTIITSGTVQFPTPASLYNAVEADWAPAKITVGNGGILQVRAGGTGFSSAQIATLLNQLTTGVTDNGFRGGSAFSINTSNGAFVLAANITDSTGTGGGAVGFRKYHANELELTGTNTYSGQTILDAGSLKVSSFNSVGSPVASSSLGRPTTVPTGTIEIGKTSFGGGNIIYTGGGETTDRVINMAGQSATYVLDQSGPGPGSGFGNNTGLLKFTSPFTMQTAAKTLTLQGSTVGTGELSAVIPDTQTGVNKLTLTKTGTGTWTLSGANLYTGVTTVSGGALVLNNATALPGGIGVSGGTSALTFNGGVVGLGVGDFTRSLAAAGTVTGVNFTNDGGWAAYNADRAVNLGGASGIVVWATANTGLNGKTLILSNSTATHMVTLQNPLDMTNGARTVQVDDGAAAIDGKLSGNITGVSGGNLTKTGLGTLALTGSNSYAGATAVNFGTLLVNGTNSGTGSITVASGATLGGTGGIAAATTFSSGAKAVFTVTRDPITLANTTPLTIAGVMTFNATEVQLNLPANLPSGVYTLATSSATPTGTVTATPVVVSGSYAAGFTSAVVSLDTVNKKLLLTVNGLPTSPTKLAITSVNGGASPIATAGFSVVVQAQDVHGDTRQVLANTDVTLSLNTGSGPLGGTLTGTIPAGSVSVTISGATYNTAESGVVLTATRTSGDSLTAGNSAPFTVLPSTAPAYLTVTGFPSPQTAGAAGSLTVTAKTAGGATASTYTGTVTFTSSAVSAGLPANYTFVGGDNGVKIFSGVTLNTAGTQSITATDTVTPSITGTQSGIIVNAATAASLVVAGYPNPRVTGLVDSVTVTAKDAYGNTAPSYTGTVQLTSSDLAASLPGAYAFTGGDAGVHVFSGVTLNTLGVQSITATDTVTATITGTQSGITVWVPPTTFTWRSPASSGNWSDATKWAQASGFDYAPITAGQADYVLDFIAGTYTATHNLTDGFLVNQLNFAGEVTLDGTSGLTLTNNGATLPTINQSSGSTVTVSNALDLVANTTCGGTGSGWTKLSGVLSGVGSLTKNGTGTLEISGLKNNTYSGGTVINTGTLKVYDVRTFSGLGTESVTLNGGVLHLDRVALTNSVLVNGGSLVLDNGFGSSMTGPITIDAPTLTITAWYANHPISGAISGSGGITLNSVAGGGVTLSVANSYTGPTSVTAGTLQCNLPDALGGGDLSISGTGKVNLNYTGIKSVASLTLGGVPQTAPGTYGSVLSGADVQSDTYFTAGSTGTVTVGTGYSAWAALYAGGAAAPADGDSNNDGVQNGLAYFMGMNGLATHPGVVGNSVTWPYFNSVTSYKVQTSTDLSPSGWTDVLPGDPKLHVTAPGPSGSVSYDLLPNAGSSLFVRLLVMP